MNTTGNIEFKGEQSMKYEELVAKDRARFIGKRVKFEGQIYDIVDVDYNGALMINKEGRFTDTTAVSRFDPSIEIL
jgi:hypothetical protein